MKNISVNACFRGKFVFKMHFEEKFKIHRSTFFGIHLTFISLLTMMLSSLSSYKKFKYIFVSEDLSNFQKHKYILTIHSHTIITFVNHFKGKVFFIAILIMTSCLQFIS